MTTGYRPSPQIALKVSQALTMLHRHWPKALQHTLGTSTAAQESANDYARAMINCDLDAITDAAQRWISEESYAPKPAELAKLARELTRDRRPVQYALSHDTGAHDDGHDWGKDLEAIERLSRLAFAEFQNWRLVSEVWSLLWETATTNEERTAVREGKMPEDLFVLAMNRVRKGDRAVPVGARVVLSDTLAGRQWASIP